MALPSDFPKRETFRRFGIAFLIVPDPASAEALLCDILVEMAPDSAGAPNSGANSEFFPFPPVPRSGAPFVVELPDDNTRRHFRWKHQRVGKSDGNWSDWLHVGGVQGAKPAELNQAVKTFDVGGRAGRVTLGAAATTSSDTAVSVQVQPSRSVSFWRLHLVQAGSLASIDCTDANLVGERKNDPDSPNFDVITAGGLLGGTTYAYRAIPYDADGVRVVTGELTGTKATTGSPPYMLSNFTINKVGSGSSATNELRWNHSTSALPGGYTVTIRVDRNVGEFFDIVTGRDPRTDANGTDSIDASGDGGYDHTVDVTGSYSVFWTYELVLKNGSTEVQVLTAGAKRTYLTIPL